MTRMDPGGRTMAADIRSVRNRSRIVVGGRIREQGDVQFGALHALQPRGPVNSGFFAVLMER